LIEVFEHYAKNDKYTEKELKDINKEKKKAKKKAKKDRKKHGEKKSWREKMRIILITIDINKNTKKS